MTDTRRTSGTPESSHGGPTYDAVMHPAGRDHETSKADRLAQDTSYHHFYDKGAAASVYSNFWRRTPNPVALAIMGQAGVRDQIDRVVSRKNDLPFPGVPLGMGPSFQRSPDTTPVIGGVSHLTHHAHLIESKRRTRARFNR